MVRLHLLGDLRLEVDGSVAGLASLSRKARLLLAILAVERRIHGRSELAGRLWPDVREDSARVSLRTALSQLRAALGPAASRVLHGERDGGVVLAREVSTDLQDIDRLLQGGDAEIALERCSAELLPGLDDDWVLEQRDELRDRLTRGLTDAADRAEREARLEDALRLSRRLVALDPLSETFGRELIRRLAGSGDRGAAITAFERLRERLRAEELRLAPSAATRELVEKIRAEPVAEAALPQRPQALAFPAARGPFAGRDAELETLMGEWRRARGGERRVAAVAGEPGIGKTRLTAELCAAAAAEGGLVVVGACHEDALVPYEPFAEVIRSYVADRPEDVLDGLLAAHVRGLSTLVPGLAERAGRGAAPSEEVGAHRLVEAIVALVRTAAASRPTLLVVEDLHWAEEATAVALRHVVRRTEDSPLLMLLTFRGSEVDEEHPLAGALAELRRARVLTELALDGLDIDAVAAIVTSEASASPPVDVVSAVHARTGGNPFFVEELVRASDDLTATDLVALPQSVKDLLTRRLRRLDRSGLAMLEAAAVVGQEFELAIVAEAAGSTPDDVLEALDDVSRDGTVVPAAGAQRFAFAHALIRESVYEGLSPIRRTRLHAAVGAALERLPAVNDGSRAAALAHHFAAAGDHDRAIVHHLAAARAAGMLGALRTALGHCDAAIASARSAGDVDPALDAAIGLERGAALHRLSRQEDAVPTLEHALAGARAAGDEALETQVLVELGVALRNVDMAQSLSVQEAALALAHRRGDVRGEVAALSRSVLLMSDALALDRAAERAERAVALARRLGDERVVAEALDARKHVAWQLGDAQLLAEATGELEPIQRRNDVRWQLCYTLLEAAHAPLAELRYDEARSRLGEALAVAERLDAFVNPALVLDALATLHEAQGAPEEALRTCRRAVELVNHGGNVGFIGWVEATAGLILLRLRAVDRATERLERGLAAAERASSRHEILRCSAFLARARWLAGDPEEGVSLAERAEALCRSITTPPGAALLYVAPAIACVADVLTAAGEAARAESLVREPLEIAARPDRAWYAIPLSMAAARCLLAQGRVDAAAAALTTALRAFEAGAFAPGWEAAALQAAIERGAGRDVEAERRSAQARSAVRALADGLADPVLRDGLLSSAEQEITAYASATSHVTS